MNKVYACSDLHGQYKLWEQISNYCDKTDKIYFLGDALDRGPDGVKIMQELLSDPRVIYLKGNHEDMLVKNMTLYLYDNEIPEEQFLIWSYNGGAPTFQNFTSCPIETQKSYIANLNRLPTFQIYKNKKNQTIFLCHAGFHPDEVVEVLWNRNHLLKTRWNGNNDDFIVHGHTPVQHLKKILYVSNQKYKEFKDMDPQVIFYCENHKIDIDLASFHTNKTALLDLDTFEPIYFSFAQE